VRHRRGTFVLKASICLGLVPADLHLAICLDRCRSPAMSGVLIVVFSLKLPEF